MSGDQFNGKPGSWPRGRATDRPKPARYGGNAIRRRAQDKAGMSNHFAKPEIESFIQPNFFRLAVADSFQHEVKLLPAEDGQVS